MLADNGSRILRLKAVLDRTGLSRSTLYWKIEHGTSATSAHLGDASVGKSDIERWVRNPMYYSRLKIGRDPLGLDWESNAEEGHSVRFM